MLVSVIMPAFNAAPFIEQALRSLFVEQGELALDVIVVDDGSTDQTAGIVTELSRTFDEIRMVRGPHAGVAAARNRGLHELPPTAEFVTFHDADDIAFPGRIARQYRRLQADHRLQVVYGLLQLFDVFDDTTQRPADTARTATLRGISLSAGLFRRQIIDRAGSFDETLCQAEDTDYLLRVAELGAVMHMENEIATYYRRHDANTTNDFRLARREFMRVIHKSIQRRRNAAGTLPASLPSLFAERQKLEEQFRVCPTPIPS